MDLIPIERIMYKIYLLRKVSQDDIKLKLINNIKSSTKLLKL